MYAIVKTGGKQYRVEEGQSLLVERLRVEDGGKAALTPLLYVDGDNVVDGEELAKVSIEARVVGHERGPKLRVIKFKPKRGYKRRTGHRQELTRIEVTSIKLGSRRAAASRPSRSAAKPEPAEGDATQSAATEKPVPAATEAQVSPEKAARARKPAGEGEAIPGDEPTPEAEAKPAAEAKPTRARRSPAKPKTEEDNGA